MAYIFKNNFYIKVETKGNVIDGLLKGSRAMWPKQSPKAIYTNCE